MLLDGASDSAVRPLIETLEGTPSADGAIPPLVVAFEARDLGTAPIGSRVVLVEAGRGAQWLNLHRPIVTQRRLTVLLWCTRASAEQLGREAPDFADWISHRIEVPEVFPGFVASALRECEEQAGVLALLDAPEAPAGWTAIGADAPYTALREGSRSGPLWVTGVRDGLHWLRVRLAHTEAGRRHGVVLADPLVIGPGEPVRAGKPLQWSVAARALSDAEDAALVAAKKDLDPTALAHPVPQVAVRLHPDKRWMALLDGASSPGPEQVELAGTLGLPDVQAAWAGAGPGALELAESLRARGRLDAAIAVLNEEERRCLDGGDLEGAAAAQVARAGIELVRGEFADAARDLDRAVPNIVEQELLAVAWAHRADVARLEGRLDEAHAILERSVLPSFREDGNERGVAVAQGMIATILHLQGRSEEALALFERIIPVFERLGDVNETVAAKKQLADVLDALERNDDAERLRREEILPAVEKLQDARALATVQGDLAEAQARSGDIDGAIASLTQQVLPRFEQMGDVRSAALTRGTIAGLLRDQGDSERALRMRLEDELPVYERIGDLRTATLTRAQIADLHLDLGNIDEALRVRTAEVRPVLAKLGDDYSIAANEGKIAGILAQIGSAEEAIRLIEEREIPVYERLGDHRSALRAKGQLASLRIQNGEFDVGLNSLVHDLLPEAERLACYSNQIELHVRIVLALARRGKPSDAKLAREHLARALDLARAHAPEDVLFLESLLQDHPEDA